MRIIWISLAALTLVGCTGETKPTTTPTPASTPTSTATPTPISKEELQKMAENVALVPSPVEMQRALERAGISEGISKLVPDRKLKLDVENQDVVAVRTGVVLADALLTVKDAPDEKLVERLELVKTGMKSLGAGDDIQRTIDDIVARIKNKGVTREDLVKELDELHGAMVPEIKYEAGEQILPLIHAGSWLAGSNLVATAILNANKPEAAETLLRQPQVVEYFQKYVKTEGTNRAPSDVLKQLDSSLATLLTVAQKRAMTAEDVTTVKTTTATVLSLL
jgi:hypothetical protein